jgi:uncharacterized protein
MGMKPKERRTLKEILQSTSDVLFPSELGKKTVTIHSRDVEGDSPLHVLVRRKDRYGVDQLIQVGAEVDVVGDMGETPLHVAIGQGDLYILESLLKAKARIDIRSEFGETAWEKAVNKGDVIAKLFRQYNKRNLGDKQGKRS